MLSKIKRAMAKSSYCTIATTSEKGRPHVTGVLYQLVDDHLYVVMKDDTRKARSIRHDDHVAICIPVAWLPGAPPKSIQFQGRAALLERDDPHIEALLNAGQLKKITGMGVLDTPGLLFAKIAPGKNIFTWGIGVSVWSILRDPVGADRATAWASD